MFLFPYFHTQYTPKIPEKKRRHRNNLRTIRRHQLIQLHTVSYSTQLHTTTTTTLCCLSVGSAAAVVQGKPSNQYQYEENFLFIEFFFRLLLHFHTYFSSTLLRLFHTINQPPHGRPWTKRFAVEQRKKCSRCYHYKSPTSKLRCRKEGAICFPSVLKSSKYIIQL